MVKKFVIINGTAGVGKTTICRELYTKFSNSVWLDGDWCWMMHPWNFTEENKKMVMDNVKFILKNFLSNTTFEYIFFSWVIHNEEIFDEILRFLNEYKFQLYKITITCTEKELLCRMKKDNRSDIYIEKNIERLKKYNQMDTIKIDTTNYSVEDVVEKIIKIITI